VRFQQTTPLRRSTSRVISPEPICLHVRDPTVELKSALTRHPGVRGVQLVGSRATGSADWLSDWDFKVESDDLASLRGALPDLVAPLAPVIQQWDPVSSEWIYMVILPGMTKVELFLGDGHRPDAPWSVTAATLPKIDAHFWDWILYIATAGRRGKLNTMSQHFGLIHENLLGPIGIERAPRSVQEAVADYKRSRTRWEEEFETHCDRGAEFAIEPFLRMLGALPTDP